MTNIACVYCPSGHGITRDHVPPRGFFEESLPSDVQLITVPCCEACRKKDMANDEIVRNILSSLKDTEPVDYVSKHVLPRRDRALARSSSQFLKMLELMHRVVEKNEKGEVTRNDVVFSLDHPRIDRFLERVGRGLLFETFRKGYFDADFSWRLNPPIPDNIYRFAVTNYPKRRILDVIAFCASRELHDVHWIIVQFYGGVEFLLRFERNTFLDKTCPCAEKSPG